MFSNKQAESFPGRDFYKGTGVDWGRYLPWLLAAFVVAAALAEGMAQLFAIGHYYIFIVPMIAALCVAGMITLAVSKGHCRSLRIAGISGFAAGVVLYIGYFYFGMIHDFGVEVAGHPEALPSYVRLRMRFEQTHDVGEKQDDKGQKPMPGNTYFNWGRFVFELTLVVVITAGAGIKRARKPYCQRCGRWMIRELTQFEPGKSEKLTEALRTQSTRSLAALCAEAPFATIPNFSLALDYCPSMKEGRSRDCPTYISGKSVTMAPKRAVLDSFEQSKGKFLVRAIQLNSDELAALAPRIKVFETIAGRSAVSALMPEPETINTAQGSDVTYAEITRLPEDQAGKVLARKTILVASIFSFVVLIGFFASLGLVLWGVLTAFPDHPPLEGVSPEAKSFGITLIIGGGVWFCVSLAVALIDPNFMGNRYVRKVLHQELERRTSPIVDKYDPNALFVEFVPKTNWGRLMLDNASDVGLMVVDEQKREIRFEADKERWRIPASAITYCEFEVFVQQQGHAKSRLYYAVVRANHRDGFWEAPIRPRGKPGLFSGRRKEATRQLFEAIQKIRGVAQVVPAKLV